MLKKSTACIALAALGLISNPASASQVISTKLSYIIPNAVGVLHIKAVATKGGTVPPCDTTQRYGIDGTTPAGQVQVAILTSAFLSGKTVDIFGTGTCTFWPGVENVDYLIVYP